MAKKVISKMKTVASYGTPLSVDPVSKASVKPTNTVAEAIASPVTPAQNSQTGGTGNANINPYQNAYESYKTNMGKVKDAQTGQLNTEYNQQQKQIQGAVDSLNRNAYVTYMQRNLANRNAAANMGVARNGMGENMQTANAVDYNRSIGNVGAYRTSQLSNAENAYNANLANINNEYEANMNKEQYEAAVRDQQRQDELDDLAAQQAFQASENAKDRAQSAYEAQQSLNATRQQNRFQVFADTISGYTTIKRIDAKIKQLKAAKEAGTLKGWQREYYSEMLSYLRAQRNVVKRNNKKKKK